MERLSSQLYLNGWDAVGLDGWLSKVVSSLRAIIIIIIKPYYDIK